MASGLTGLNGLAGINAITESDPFLTPAERYGSPVNPFHAQVGEQAEPYPWESMQTQAGSHGPYGPENQLLSDEMWYYEPAGMADEDPSFDYNMPDITRSHASVHNVSNSGAAPSQAEAIDLQIAQMGNKSSDLNTSRRMGFDETLYANQDEWAEVWNVTSGHDDLPQVPGAVAYQANGVGANDHTSNPFAKVNAYGLNAAHFHRRFAIGSIPGNYMWLRPGGRPMFKTLPGPARPAVGGNSPFVGDDLGEAFGIQGAILQNIPQEYVPPPSPYLSQPTPVYDNPYGTDGVDIY
jgi:hypothetical protein